MISFIKDNVLGGILGGMIFMGLLMIYLFIESEQEKETQENFCVLTIPYEKNNPQDWSIEIKESRALSYFLYYPGIRKISKEECLTKIRSTEEEFDLYNIEYIR